ncbi:MAG: hypothetical protein LHW48_05790, partial [Candidatus Cloacimonetes bacterium]|nr:hypothetical protein [Candidatus Cloacimonadota bacterium]
KWAAKLLLGRGSGAAFRSELRSLWQTELATPKVGIACSRICSNQNLATLSQIRLCCAVCAVAWAAKLPLGRGSGAAFRSELRSLWQTELATPKVGIACSGICGNQNLATPACIPIARTGFPWRNSDLPVL